MYYYRQENVYSFTETGLSSLSLADSRRMAQNTSGSYHGSKDIGKGAGAGTT